MLESQKKRLHLEQLQKQKFELESQIREISSAIAKAEINIQSAIVEEISRENNLTLVSQYKIGSGLPEKGELVSKKLLKDFDESFQKEILEKGKVVSIGGVNSLCWGGERFIIES